MLRILPLWLVLVGTAALAQPRLVVNTGHTDDVTSVVLSSDRTLALTASKDQTARIWDVASGREKLRMSDHDDWVNTAVFSPDDRFVATGTADSHVNLYSASDGQLIRKVDAGGWFIARLAFTPDGRNLVSADRNGDLVVWSADLVEERHRFPLDIRISAMALTPSGREVIVGSEDGELLGVSLSDGAVLTSFQGHEDYITSIGTFLDLTDDLAIVSASEDGTVIVRNALSGEGARSTELSTDNVPDWPPGDFPTAIAFSPDYGKIAVGHRSGRLRTIDIRERKQLDIGQAHIGARINGIAFSKDGTAVISGAERGEAKLWRVSDGKTLGRFVGRVDSVEKIAIRPDERVLASGSGYLDHEVSGWSLVGGTNVGRLAGSDRVRSLQFSPTEGDLLAYTFDDPDDPITFWNNASETRFAFESTFDDEAVALAFSPDGRRLLAYGRFRAQLFDVDTRNAGGLPGFSFPVGVAQISVESSYVDGRGEEVVETVVYDLPPGRTSAAWSPDGRYIAMGVSSEPGLDFIEERNFAYVWSADSGDMRKKIGPVKSGVTSLRFSPDGRELLISSDGGASIWDVESGENRIRLDHDGAYLNTAIWMPDGRHVVTGGRDRVVRVWEVADGKEVREFRGHTSAINDLALLRGGELIVSASKDGTIRLWDNVRGDELGQLVSFGREQRSGESQPVARRGGEWAVIDPAGRFDASNGGDVDGLHWVVDDEVVALSQLKDRFYEPGLLAKLLGFNPEPVRDVSDFAATGVALFPEVEVVHAPDTGDPVLRFTVTNRGGGIGPVRVLINGKEVTEDARPPGTDPRAPSIDLSLDLDGHPFLRRDSQNRIEFVTANAEQSLTSRGIGITIARNVTPVADEPAEPPRIWAVAVGVSDYSGNDIDLKFADKDAASFAAAIELAARGLVSRDRVSVRLINGDPVPATRSTLQQTMEEIAGQASSSDILILYLAGHGVTYGGSDADYYYVMQDAASLDISDPAVRARVAISSQELTALINKVPALKQVLILDTCASGQLISDLVSSRGVPSAQMRSIERMKDRTGMFILAGSAADAVSYEASPYGQGLLTYSLLEGMRGPALREASYVDVDRLFGFATDRVQLLAHDLGGVQQPRVSDPQTGSFDIGLLNPEDQAKIQVATPKPIVISSMFQDEERIRDYLGLGGKVDEALRAAAAAQGSGFVFFSAQSHPFAYSLAGRYQVSGSSIQVTVVMARGDASTDRFSVTGTTNDLPALQAQIVNEMRSRLH